MTALGAYQKVPAFAYPGWRLTIPGGPAGGHYKGFTHNYSAGTGIASADEFEADRAEGRASHDTVHLHPNAPRGVYRGPAEVPPRPNASGAAMTYRDYMTKRHAGTSVAPGLFPADFIETDEDAFLTGLAAYAPSGAVSILPFPENPPQMWRPNVVAAPVRWSPIIARPINAPFAPPTSGATSVVAQPSTPAHVSQTQAPAPAPSVPSSGILPMSPAPAPVVSSGVVIPDGGGNYVDAGGNSFSASDVQLNPLTQQFQARPGATPSALASAESWLTQHSLYSGLPNWYFVAGGAALLLFFFHRGRR
jgi:hypothetical protein